MIQPGRGAGSSTARSARARQEIASLRVDDITDRDIPFATDELDAIVEHTAGATNAILESCEMMEEVAASSIDDQFAQLETTEDDVEVEARLAQLKSGG